MSHISIDFGSSVCTLAHLNAKGQPELIGEEPQTACLPAVLLEALQGTSEGSPSRMYTLFKRDLGVQTARVFSPTEAVLPEEAALQMLQQCKVSAEAILNEPISELTLTHPICFSSAARQALKGAAEDAGFQQILLLPDPLAAVYGQESKGHRLGRSILVWDLGAGYCEATYILREGENLRTVDWESVVWGGGDFDRLLASRCEEEWDARFDGALYEKFLQRCCDVKEELSVATKRRISWQQNRSDWTRKRLETLWAEKLDVVFDALRTLISRIKQTADPFELDCLLLLGGLSHLPKLGNLLKEILTAEGLQIEPTPAIDSAVALGAARLTPAAEETRRQHEESRRKLDDEMQRQGLLDMVQIPAGRYQRGSAPGMGSANEEPLFWVNIQSFYLSRTPITQKQYERIMGNNPSKFTGCLDRPVERVSWENAIAFCNGLSREEGLPEAYDPQGNLIPHSGGYRLPTEAEWEYACRAGSTSPWSCGSNMAELCNYAWFDENAERQTQPVGQKKPNAFGLYDMHGNVAEWVEDIYLDNYKDAPIDGSAQQGEADLRVVRGGSCIQDAEFLRSACRQGMTPTNRNCYRGFRVAR